jgi:DNA-binding response OmpR family regulator
MARVLIIEDDPRVLDILAELVEGFGHDVVRATTGAAGLAVADRERFDLIMLDLLLPDLHGESVLRRLAEADGRRPIIVLTGSIDPSFERRGLELGAFDIVRKPVGFEELKRLVDRALEGGIR